MTDQKWYVWIWILNFKCYVILLIPCIPWSNQMIHSPNNFNTFSGLLKRFWVRGLWYKVGSNKQFHSHQCHASVLNIEPWAFRRVSWLIWHSSLLYPWEKFRKQSAKKYNIVSKGNNLWDLISERIILRTDMIWIFDILGTK